MKDESITLMAKYYFEVLTTFDSSSEKNSLQTVVT